MPQMTRALQMADRVHSVHSEHGWCTENNLLAITTNDHGITRDELNA